MTREEWLNRAVNHLRSHFADAGITLPRTIRVSCGWPSRRATSRSRRTIGQCFPTAMAADKVPQLFISPVLAEPTAVLTVLAHELVHAADDCSSGHRGEFVRMAKAVGLVAPWTATTASEELQLVLERMAAELGEYPHAELVPSNKIKKDGTRMLKIECRDCGFVARTTRKWIDDVGLPTCACGGEFEEE